MKLMIGSKIRRLLYLSKFRKLGISWWFLIKNRNNKKMGLYKLPFLGNDFLFSSPFWFLHSLEEIFLEELYDVGPLSKDSVILDCGSNWGLSVLYLSRKYPNNKIYAFEPDKNIFEILLKNVENYNLHNVTCFNKAVWTEETKQGFYSDMALGGSLFKNSLGEKKTGGLVETVSLLPFFEKYHIGFLKMDIEGAEFDVIKGLESVVYQVDKLFIEYHSSPATPQNLPELLQILKKSGFRYYIKEAWSARKQPFKDYKKQYIYDLQLNIFAYKIN